MQVVLIPWVVVVVVHWPCGFEDVWEVQVAGPEPLLTHEFLADWNTDPPELLAKFEDESNNALAASIRGSATNKTPTAASSGNIIVLFFITLYLNYYI
jgi:hypothetical protein